jgi:hypothetical protein
MKCLILALFMGIGFYSMGQNGGQYPENNSVKLEWAGTSVKITNKQACESIIRVTYSQTSVDLTIAGNSSMIFMPPAAIATIKAKNTTNCGNSDFGLVELSLVVTPVKFASFDFEPIGNKEVLVTFKTTETSNIKQYNILISIDGVHYKAIDSVKADQVTPNRTYSIKINTSNFKKQ